MHLLRAALPLPLCLGLLCLLLSSAGAEDKPPPDPLARVNQVFRSAYARHRKAVLDAARPVLLVDGGDLHLLTADGKRRKGNMLPPPYDELKGVHHTALATYTLLLPLKDGPVDDDARSELRSLRNAIGPARDCLPARGYAGEQLTRLNRILDESRQALDQVLEAGRAKESDTRAFAKRMGPLIQIGAADAVKVQLDALHAQMKEWRKELTPEEWAKLQVVVIGSQMPRRENAAVQYFARLLGEKGEGPRITYAEALWEEPQALRLLGTRLVDTDIGVAFFGDPQRMHIDLLGPAAKTYLEKMTFDP